MDERDHQALRFPKYVTARSSAALIVLALINAVLPLGFLANTEWHRGQTWTPAGIRYLGFAVSVAACVWIPFLMFLAGIYSLRPTEQWRSRLHRLGWITFPLAAVIFFLLLDASLPIFSPAGTLAVAFGALEILESAVREFGRPLVDRYLESSITSAILAGFGVLVYLHASQSRRISRVAGFFLYPLLFLFALAMPLAICIMLMCTKLG